VAYCIDEDPAGSKFARHTVRAFRVGLIRGCLVIQVLMILSERREAGEEVSPLLDLRPRETEPAVTAQCSAR